METIRVTAQKFQELRGLNDDELRRSVVEEYNQYPVHGYTTIRRNDSRIYLDDPGVNYNSNSVEIVIR